MKTLSFFFLVFLSPIIASYQKEAATNAHPFHLSLTEIEYKTQKKSLEIAIKFFTDDLEIAVQENTKERLHLNTKKEVSTADKILKKYISDHFQLKNKNTELPLQWVGLEHEGDATWIYVEVINVKKLKKLQITTIFLLQTFDDQQNMVNVRQNGKLKKSLLLSKSNPQGTIIF